MISATPLLVAVAALIVALVAGVVWMVRLEGRHTRRMEEEVPPGPWYDLPVPPPR